MTDFFKDVFEAAQQRIRSPFIGSVIFAFIAVNWQALFYLFFADVSVQRRIDCFNDMTSNVSLYWLPFGIGTAMAVVMPWLRFAGAWIAVKPASLLADLQGNEASRRRIARLLLKAKEDEALDKANEARELRKINEEKRLKEASEAGGEALVEEIKKDRVKVEEPDRVVNTKETELLRSLDLLGKLTIFTLGKVSKGPVNIDALPQSGWFRNILLENGYQYSGVRLEQEFSNVIVKLRQDDVVELSRVYGDHPEYTGAKLTAFGYKMFDQIMPDYVLPEQSI